MKLLKGIIEVTLLIISIPLLIIDIIFKAKWSLNSLNNINKFIRKMYQEK